MLFAVDHINRDRSLLPGIMLGAHVLDTCSHETYALDQSLEYVRASLNVFDPSMFRCDDKSTPDIVHQPDPVIGVVGGSYSSVSTQVGFTLFSRPRSFWPFSCLNLHSKIVAFRICFLSHARSIFCFKKQVDISSWILKTCMRSHNSLFDTFTLCNLI